MELHADLREAGMHREHTGFWLLQHPYATLLCFYVNAGYIDKQQ